MAVTEAQLKLMGLVKMRDGSYAPKSKAIKEEVKVEVPVAKDLKKKLPKKGTEEHTKARVYWKYMNVIDIFESCKRNKEIWIPGNVPSSKNSKRAFKGIVLESELCVKYRKDAEAFYLGQKDYFHELIKNKQSPYKVHFKFIRNIDNGWDFINITQLPCDLMQKHGWLGNDDHKHIIPVFDEPAIDVENPGVVIWVE